MNSLRDSDNPRINEVANSIEALELYLKGDIDIGGSLEWRRELVKNGLEELKKSNGLGVGAGGATALQEEKGGVAGRFTSMHNFWIEILVEGGIVIGLFGLFWYINIIYNLFLVTKNKKSPELKFFSQSLILSMIGFIPSAISASSTIYFFPMWIMFGLAISVIIINDKSLINMIY
jgi:teichuronic acid biosynthesis protein TuaE